MPRLPALAPGGEIALILPDAFVNFGPWAPKQTFLACALIDRIPSHRLRCAIGGVMQGGDKNYVGRAVLGVLESVRRHLNSVEISVFIRPV